MKVSLDTNVFLAIKNKEPDYEYSELIIDNIEAKKIEGVMSVIVLAELLVGFYQNAEKEEADQFSSSALMNYDIIPVNHDVAKKSAQIRAQYNIKLPDAIITFSTMLSESDFLITNDKELHKKLKIQKITPKDFVEKYIKEEKKKE
jgi:predicted nucleic acid-binding protein